MDGERYTMLPVIALTAIFISDKADLRARKSNRNKKEALHSKGVSSLRRHNNP